MKSDFEVTETRTEYCKHCKEEQVFTKHWTGAWIDVYKHEWTWIGSLSYWQRFFFIMGIILATIVAASLVIALGSYLLILGYGWVLLGFFAVSLIIGFTFFFTTILG